MKATTTIQTEKASRYMKALVNHFGRKTDAGYEADKGYVEFGFGRCDIQAAESTLSFQLKSTGAEELDRLKWIVSKHLTRFSQDEITELAWQPQ